MRKCVLLLAILLLAFFLTQYACADTVKLKMIVVNPSETETKTIPVKTFLPKNIRPEDIVDKGNFTVSYDFQKTLYFAYQEVSLKPKETMILELEMSDVWVVPEEEIHSLKEHTQRILGLLQKTEYASQAKILSDGIISRLDKILALQFQAEFAPEKRISDYEINSTLLKEAKKNIGVLEDLAMETADIAGAVVDGLMGTVTSSAPDSTDVLDMDLDIEKLGTVKFRIEILNPRDEGSASPLKYYLPVEVKPEYIVEKGNLEVGYDYQKGIHYVYNDTVILAPHEKKEFVIEVKDIWTISEQQINILKVHTKKLIGILSGSAYKLPAESLGKKAISTLDNILNIQKDSSVSVEGHIGNYRENLVRFDIARQDIAKLERMALQTGGSVGLNVTQAISNKTSQAKVNTEFLGGTKGMEWISESVFRGKAPDTATSWKIIWIILSFLGVISFLFFILWWLQIKKGDNSKKEKIN